MTSMARAVDKLKSYDAIALAVEKPRVRKEVDARAHRQGAAVGHQTTR